MEYRDLYVGQTVRIADNHESGYGGKKGKVILVGIFRFMESDVWITGAKIEVVGLAGPLVMEAEALEPAEPDAEEDEGFIEV